MKTFWNVTKTGRQKIYPKVENWMRKLCDLTNKPLYSSRESEIRTHRQQSSTPGLHPQEILTYQELLHHQRLNSWSPYPRPVFQAVDLSQKLTTMTSPAIWLVK